MSIRFHEQILFHFKSFSQAILSSPQFRSGGLGGIAGGGLGDLDICEIADSSEVSAADESAGAREEQHAACQISCKAYGTTRTIDSYLDNDMYYHMYICSYIYERDI